MNLAIRVPNASTLRQPVKIFIRGKRTKSRGSLSPQVQRAVTQLSVMSASRKQPKILKLSKEDFIKHQTIQACWSQYQREIREERRTKLAEQFNSIKSAMTLLEEVDPELFNSANTNDAGKLFPLELRVPTQFPPNMIWYYNYKSKQ